MCRTISIGNLRPAGKADERRRQLSTDYRARYFSRTQSGFPDEVEILGIAYEKVEDLRYGTNPHQPASFYRPKNSSGLAFGDMEILKQGKSGLSETNYGDLNHGANIVKYFDRPACAVMKHLNPSGAAVRTHGESTRAVYTRARDADAVAAFGGTVVFNTRVDPETARELMTTVVEVVASPEFDAEALDILNDHATYRMNKEIRVIRLPGLDSLPKWVGDAAMPTIKTLADGTVVVAEALLTAVRGPDDLRPARTEHPSHGDSDAGGDKRSAVQLVCQPQRKVQWDSDRQERGDACGGNRAAGPRDSGSASDRQGTREVQG